MLALELPLAYVGRGEYELLVPGEADWRNTMPDWVKHRRAEVIARLEVVFGRSGMRVNRDDATAGPDASG